jgi:hypothetical protein
MNHTKIIHSFLNSEPLITESRKNLFMQFIAVNKSEFELQALKRNLSNFIAISLQKKQFEIAQCLFNLGLSHDLINQDMLIDIFQESIKAEAKEICEICIKTAQEKKLGDVVNALIPILGDIPPIALAIAIGSREMVIFLCQKGSNLANLIQFDGLEVPLIGLAILVSRNFNEAGGQKFSKIIDSLLEYGADISGECSMLSFSGENSRLQNHKMDYMHLAIEHQMLDIINILLKHGFKQNEFDSDRLVLSALTILSDVSKKQDANKIEVAKSIVDILVRSKVFFVDDVEQNYATQTGYQDLADLIKSSRESFEEKSLLSMVNVGENIQDDIHLSGLVEQLDINNPAE